MQVFIAPEHAESVWTEAGNRSQVKLTQEFDYLLQPQVTLFSPEIGTLLH